VTGRLADKGFACLDSETDAGEWREAWARLARLVGAKDNTQECREHGEVWQYMGSPFESCAPGAGWHHEFRHRCGASCDGIGRGNRCERVPASPGWLPLEVRP
jgi:hypothetical protein